MTARPALADERRRLDAEIAGLLSRLAAANRRRCEIDEADAAGRVAPPARDPDLLTAKQAAAILGVHRDTAVRWARSFGIGQQLPSGMWQFFRHRVEGFQRGEFPTSGA